VVSPGIHLSFRPLGQGGVSVSTRDPWTDLALSGACGIRRALSSRAQSPGARQPDPEAAARGSERVRTGSSAVDGSVGCWAFTVEGRDESWHATGKAVYALPLA
jgi:hypothetical protein